MLNIKVALIIIMVVYAFAVESSQESIAMELPERSIPQYAASVLALKPHFENALQHGGPLYRSSISSGYFERMGVDLKYCFEYRWKSSAQHYSMIRSLVDRYSGPFRWTFQSEFNGKGACLSSTPINQIRTSGASLPNAVVTLEDMIEEAKGFCKYLESQLPPLSHPESLAPKPVNPANLLDPDAPGMYEIYVLADPNAGIYGELHATDRHLHFSPTFEEWRHLMLAIHKIEPASPEAESFGALKSPVPGFQLISRMAGPYDRAQYTFSDLAALRTECQSAIKLLHGPLGRRAVEKVLSAVEWAEQLNSGLVFDPAN